MWGCKACAKASSTGAACCTRPSRPSFGPHADADDQACVCVGGGAGVRSGEERSERRKGFFFNSVVSILLSLRSSRPLLVAPPHLSKLS